MLEFEEVLELAVAIKPDAKAKSEQAANQIFIDGRLDTNQLFPFKCRYSVEVRTQKVVEVRIAGKSTDPAKFVA